MNARIRPRGITILSIFFAAGAIISFTSAISLLFPGSILEPMWKLNPRAREAFENMGSSAVVLMTFVCVACSAASIGMWRGKRWGYVVGLALMILDLIGDSLNVAFGVERRAVIGIPIALLILFYLSRKKTRTYFS